jgi:hypothetical protein
MSDASAATGRVSGPPDGRGDQARGFRVVVVNSETIGTGESSSGARPITMMIFVIA